MTRQLLAIDGVRDGAFLMPEDGAAGEAPRLAAVAVAPGMDAAAILAKLREQIDAAFLPRPLLIVAALPRNALGKLPRADIVRMFGSAAEATASPAPVIICFPADHPTSAGHFPGNSIIPGAVLLDRLLADWRAGGWAADIEAAKFHHPVRPGDAVSVACGPNGSAIRFEGRLAQSGTLVLSGVARSASPANPCKA